MIVNMYKNLRDSIHINAYGMFFLMSAYLLYEEIVFHLSAFGMSNFNAVHNLLAFSIGWGAIGTVFSCMSIDSGMNRRIHHTITVLIALIFLIEYFVYMQFKMFYDLRTIANGAMDVLGGFSTQILRLVFSLSGMIHLVLFALPAIVDFILIREIEPLRFGRRDVSAVSAFAVLITLIVNMSIETTPAQKILLSEQYSFTSAVRHFGLVSGLCIDAGNIIYEQGSEFETVSEEEPVEEIVKTYEPAVLDIDFEALAASGTPQQAAIDEYVKTLTPSYTNDMTGLFKDMNLIFISAEAFSKELIDPQRTPALYRMASKGITFSDYYQPASAGTTGGEYQNIFGCLPMYGGASMKMTADEDNSITISGKLNELGYNGWAFHNNDYMYYDRHITHNNLGFSNGFMGYGNGMEEYVQRKWPESDLEMIEGTLDLYLEHEPFDVYYMTVSGHNPYSNWLSEKHISRIQETGHTKEVRNYLAANMELEDAMAYLIRKLEEAGIADRTVIVLTADHFPYGLDYNAAFDQTVNLADLYGYQPASYLERDHNALLIWSGCLEQMEHIEVTDPVSSLDILPTLCNLFDVHWDSRLLPGRDVFSHKDPLVFTVNYEWKTDLGMYVNDTFYPLSEDIPEGYADTVIAIVRNKIKYCSDVLQYSYFTHVMHDQSVTD